MRKSLVLVTAIFLSLPSFAGGSAERGNRTDHIVLAANSFLSSLSPEQRQKVLYAFNDAKQRARWSNFPTGFIPRGGTSPKEMNTSQRDAVPRSERRPPICCRK